MYFRVGHIGKTQEQLFAEEKELNNLARVLGLLISQETFCREMLAFALQETEMYDTVTFSVCHHAKNTMLDKSINRYKALICGDRMFSSFTSYDVLDAVCTQDYDLQKWMQWYKEVYCF
ncbi:MAG TPA: hypothetical protein IAA99_08215 [Candidatus Avibacteroides faecavium]|nr:hypothetical protein [Candidatus Avibacteroides faecavium]